MHSRSWTQNRAGPGDSARRPRRRRTPGSASEVAPIWPASSPTRTGSGSWMMRSSSAAGAPGLAPRQRRRRPAIAAGARGLDARGPSAPGPQAGCSTRCTRRWCGRVHGYDHHGRPAAPRPALAVARRPHGRRLRRPRRPTRCAAYRWSARPRAWRGRRTGRPRRACRYPGRRSGRVSAADAPRACARWLNPAAGHRPRRAADWPGREPRGRVAARHAGGSGDL